MPSLFLQVQAGFANRLRAMISGICFAEDLQLDLYVYWNSQDSACSIPFEKVFDTQTLPPFVKVINGILPKTVECLSSSDKDRILKEWDHTRDLSLRSYGIFHRPRMDTWLHYLRRLQPTEEIRQQVDTLFPPFEKERIIGVHIRRGDNVKSIQMSPFENFLEQMDSIDAFFVVATDDSQVKHFLAERYGSRILFPSRTLNRNTEQGMMDAMLDFFCLTRCSRILGSQYSSFNEIAALYGKSHLELI
jgi:hypothetical protein